MTEDIHSHPQQHSKYLRCSICHLVCQFQDGDVLCPRCHTKLHYRKSNSINRAWAFLLTAIIFYIPANILPVMNTSMMGSSSNSTIFDGVLTFWKTGSWDIALVIFIASVAIPCSKFLILGMLLINVKRTEPFSQKECTRLYRFLEFIGYWSMLDVMVVAIVAGLVKFNFLSDIEPRIGILFFGFVVIFTMVAAMLFDPRLLWDKPYHHDITKH